MGAIGKRRRCVCMMCYQLTVKSSQDTQPCQVPQQHRIACFCLFTSNFYHYSWLSIVPFTIFVDKVLHFKGWFRILWRFWKGASTFASDSRKPLSRTSPCYITSSVRHVCQYLQNLCTRFSLTGAKSSYSVPFLLTISPWKIPSLNRKQKKKKASLPLRKPFYQFPKSLPYTWAPCPGSSPFPPASVNLCSPPISTNTHAFYKNKQANKNQTGTGV